MDPSAAVGAVSDSGQTSSSKVKVEYTDPSGVFPQIAQELQSRLPLRNLNWNSHSRPLRSIESLFVELVPSALATQPGGLASSQDGDPSASRTSLHRQSESPAPQKERRHQIPGLRSTPYLKIYLLRCDDSEIYKASSRKLLREWIKSHNSDNKKSASSSNQEKHDAFEWLIVHVAPVEKDIPWPSKPQSSVLDKIKSDFNSSSKSAIDRVTQIPLANSIRDERLPVGISPAGPGHDLFAREFNRAWDDLLAKLKALILNSFDSRVRQYEDDIKEKGSQRSLPGWNFCTFFMLKEGLARGFESVGLIEDALMGYDELAVELLSAIRDQEEKTGGESATLFREYTAELLQQADAALMSEELSLGERKPTDRAVFSIDAEKKPYRELILANNISTFDFRCYLFARQMSVLQRIASVPLSAAKVEASSADPAVLAEICRRAVSFISSNSRAVRLDLQTALKAKENNSVYSWEKQHVVIENLVASWIYIASQQVLNQTEEPSLSRDLEQIIRSTPRIVVGRASSKAPSRDPPRPSMKDLPQRSSSMRPQSVSLHNGPQNLPGTEHSPSRGPPSNQRKLALVRLASQRAELFLLSRRALSTIGERIGWKSGWRSLKIQDADDDMEEVDLDDQTSSRAPTKPSEDLNSEPHFMSSILSDTLRDAIRDEDAFNSNYEDLSWEAYNLFQYADDDRSVHAMFADIATLRFQVGDYSTATSYFHQLAPFYAEHEWNELELTILNMYARSLKELNNAEEYVRTALKLLAKAALQARRDRKLLVPISQVSLISGTSRMAIARGHLPAIIAASMVLKEPCMTPLRNLFQDIQISPHIHHREGSDGFGLTMTLEHLMPDELNADGIRIKLIRLTEGQNREIWLASEGPVKMEPGKVKIMVESKTLIPDRYLVDKIVIKAGNVIFQHEYAPLDAVNERSGGARDSISSVIMPGVNKEPVLVWAPGWALTVSASASPAIHLDEPRSILLELRSGSADVSSAKLQLKAGSAGLRMHTADCKLLEGDCEIVDKNQPGVILLKDIAANSIIKLTVPYQLDQELKDIMFRSEVTYTSATGEWTTGNSHSFSVVLPLEVNVQDIFKASFLFSKFSISTSSSSVPLRVLACSMESTRDYEAVSPPQHAQDEEGGGLDLAVFAKQPVYMVYRTARTFQVPPRGRSLETRMLMQVRYQCLDEEIVAAIQDCLLESLDREGQQLRNLKTLILPHLLGILRDKLTGQDLTLIGLLREIGLAAYADFQWEQHVLPALPSERQQALRQWLQAWHKNNTTISLFSDHHANSAPIRTITIPVDVPSMDILHTASLTLSSATKEGIKSSGSGTYTIGHAIPAELCIKHTRAWSQRRRRRQRRQSPQLSEEGGEIAEEEDASSLIFAYELDAPPDTWLIGGHRRALFSAAEGEMRRFTVLLLPQRAGHLMLPSLEIRPVGDNPATSHHGGGGGLTATANNESQQEKKEDGEEEGEEGAGIESLSCEVDYLNLGEAVLVVPALGSTTVALEFEAGGSVQGQGPGHGGGGGGGGASSWLIEAEPVESVLLN